MKRIWKRVAGMLLAAVLLMSMGMMVFAKGISYSDLSGDSMVLYDFYSRNNELEKLTGMLEEYIETGELPQDVGFHLSNFSTEDARILLQYIKVDRYEFHGEWTEEMLEIRETLPSDWTEYMKWLYAAFKSSNESGLDGLGTILERYIDTGELPGGVFSSRWFDIDKARVMLEYITGNSGSDSAREQEHTKTAEEKIQDEAVKEIDRAIQSGSFTAVFDGRYYVINTLSRDLMGEINRRGVDMVFKYTYNGYNYEITIPAGQAPVDPDVQWCGPMYLYGMFADTAVVTPVA